VTQSAFHFGAGRDLLHAEARLLRQLHEEVGDSHLVGQFFTYHRANPTFFSLLHKFACQVRDRGRKHFGIAAIFERVRWEMAMETTDPQGFKLNNNLRAYYARLLALYDPTLAELFETRALTRRTPEEETHDP
jgi:hypothetical protein